MSSGSARTTGPGRPDIATRYACATYSGIRSARSICAAHLATLAEHPPVVDFLERLAVGEIAADLADEDDHRRRILRRRVDADGSIRCARPPRDEGDARAPGQLAVRLRHVGGAAFLPADEQVAGGRGRRTTRPAPAGSSRRGRRTHASRPAREGLRQGSRRRCAGGSRLAPRRRRRNGRPAGQAPFYRPLAPAAPFCRRLRGVDELFALEQEDAVRGRRRFEPHERQHAGTRPPSRNDCARPRPRACRRDSETAALRPGSCAPRRGRLRRRRAPASARAGTPAGSSAIAVAVTYGGLLMMRS